MKTSKKNTPDWPAIQSKLERGQALTPAEQAHIDKAQARMQAERAQAHLVERTNLAKLKAQKAEVADAAGASREACYASCQKHGRIHEDAMPVVLQAMAEEDYAWLAGLFRALASKSKEEPGDVPRFIASLWLPMPRKIWLILEPGMAERFPELAGNWPGFLNMTFDAAAFVIEATLGGSPTAESIRKIADRHGLPRAGATWRLTFTNRRYHLTS